MTMTTGAGERKSAGRKLIRDGYQTFSDRVGRIIRARRIKLGMTLDDVAVRTNRLLSGSQVSQYERGTEPGFGKLLLLCYALGVGVEDVLPADARKAFAAKSRRGRDVLAALGDRPVAATRP